MAASVLRHVDRCPDKTALSFLHGDGSEDWTYRHLAQAVRGTAQGLMDMGIVAGDRVINRLGNTADVPVAYLGCITAGIIPVPLSMQLKNPKYKASPQISDPWPRFAPIRPSLMWLPALCM